VAPAGTVIREWKLGDIISAHMAAHGEDPKAFVRFGIDWFHMNATAYDPRDDSIILSSRENFVIKVKYQTGEIVWILGDPTKYWYTFPSLRAKALTLEPPGLYPIGQHTVSITSDGLLLLFNNGEASLNNPAGTARGENRAYSVVSAYEIDPIAQTAREARRFDYGNSIHSRFCSSVFETKGSLLVSYSRANDGTRARLVGVDPLQRVVFDFEYVNPGGCNTSFSASPIAFDEVVFP
jgi:arylsulfate sulfotransferase